MLTKDKTSRQIKLYSFQKNSLQIQYCFKVTCYAYIPCVGFNGSLHYLEDQN